MMVTKKKVTKSNFEKKFDDVKNTTTKTAKQVEKEFKAKTTGFSSWWSRANDEERIYMILGIVLLAIGLYVLRQFIGGLMLIIVGLLFVTGFFVTKHK